MEAIYYVILAAGASTRMGFPKAVAPLAGITPIARLCATLGGRRAAVVTTSELHDACSREAPGALVLVNERPQSGMSSSLRVADSAIDSAATIAVLLADKPLLSRETLERCEQRLASTAADVLYVRSSRGVPGHPVYFRPAARSRLGAAPSGDSLAAVRDDPALACEVVATDDPGAFEDLDSPGDWRRAERSESR
ncbi:MAG TPA: NTP transferase domain-containing protein [Candidatus Acidoferrales bacterium]|nr:NTP transferase domain-containing protein [Candidatus Acidoferrales bacterium]